MIGDRELKGGQLYGMLPADAGDSSGGRTPPTAQCGRSSSNGPDKEDQADPHYPLTTGRNFAEILRAISSIQLTARFAVSRRPTGNPGEDVVIMTPCRTRTRSSLQRLRDDPALSRKTKQPSAWRPFLFSIFGRFFWEALTASPPAMLPHCLPEWKGIIPEQAIGEKAVGARPWQAAGDEFHDKPTGSIRYVVADPATARRCAIIDPVLDFDEKSGAGHRQRRRAARLRPEQRTGGGVDPRRTHPHADHFSAAHYLRGA